MINHDALFKSLLKTGRLLRDFLEAFLPDISTSIDFDQLEFVDKERFTLDGKRRTGDLLIKTKFRGGDTCFLIHLEHEAQANRDLARRMLEYFVLDWREFNLPIYPIAVLSHKQNDPTALPPLRMSIRAQSILDFNFVAIDLARLDAMEYVRKLNAAAVALSARMRVDSLARSSLALDFITNTVLAKLTSKELDAVSRFFFAYQEFKGKEGLKLQQKLSNIQNMQLPKEVLKRNPLVRFGRAEGREEGRKEGRHLGESELVLRQLIRRLGPVPPRQQQAIRRLPLPAIEALGEALLDFEIQSDLSSWLNKNKKGHG